MRVPTGLTAETERGHRRGVVLGLTMAELLLLLLFCLLLAAAGVIQQKDARILELGAPSYEPPLKPEPDERPTVEQLQKVEAQRDDALKQLQNITQYAPSEFQDTTAPIPSDTWTELVRAKDYVDALQSRNGRLVELPSSQSLEAAGRLEEIAKTSGRSVDELLVTAEQSALSPSGHQWPPIITLGSDDFRFKLNSAELSDDFRERLQTDVAAQVTDLLMQYDVDVVEVVGHTDEQPIYSTQSSTLDFDAIPALAGTVPISRLKPADNAGLGLARAIAVANALRSAGLPTTVRIIPLSAAQLVIPGDIVSNGADAANNRDRRRIEIRIRRSTASIPQ